MFSPKGALLALSIGLLGAPAGAASMAPVAPAPAPAALADGLAVDYYFEVFNSIDDLLDWMDSAKPKAGPPLPRLDYKVGFAKVLTADSSNFVGAHIQGLIHLARAGEYAFEVTSNDGVRIDIGGEPFFEDPEVHPDTTSDPIRLKIETPGWYALEILYFEKKNTSTLILKWRPPGAGGFELVPASAFKHPKR